VRRNRSSVVARLGVVHLQEAVGSPTGQEDRHVHQGDHPGLLHEGRDIEAVLLAAVLGDYRPARVDGEGLGAVLLHGHAHVAHDVRIPADARPDEELSFGGQDLQDLGASGFERFADEAAGLDQDLVEVLGT
jgi:hypothetical protein